MNITGETIRHRQEYRRGAPPTIDAVCALCGRVRALTDLRADEALYECVRRVRPDALAVPLVCVDRRGCDRANAKARKGA